MLLNRRRALAALAGLLAAPNLAGAEVRRTQLYRNVEVPQGRTRAGVLACDSFSGRSALGSTDGVPHRAGAGLTWTQQSGTIAPASGALKASSAGICTIDPGVADAFRVWFQCVGAPNANNNNRFAFRFTDVSNYLALVVTSSSISFNTIIAGTPAGIGSASTGVSPAAGDLITLSVNGNAFSAQLFRAGVATGTAASVSSNSTGAGVTPMGFRFGDTTFSVTNLLVTRL